MSPQKKRKDLIKKGKKFLGKNLTKDDGEFKAWYSATIRFAKKIYKKKYNYVRELKKIKFDDFDKGVKRVIDELEQMDFDVGEYRKNKTWERTQEILKLIGEIFKSMGNKK